MTRVTTTMVGGGGVAASPLGAGRYNYEYNNSDVAREGTRVRCSSSSSSVVALRRRRVTHTAAAVTMASKSSCDGWSRDRCDQLSFPSSSLHQQQFFGNSVNHKNSLARGITIIGHSSAAGATPEAPEAEGPVTRAETLATLPLQFGMIAMRVFDYALPVVLADSGRGMCNLRCVIFFC